MGSLILLSLLNERELYGYEINRILREKYSHFTRVSFSTIYYTLDQLTEKGLITKREEKVGNRPVRSIYKITPAGKKESQKKLLKSIRKEGKRTRHMDPFNLPFSLMGKLPQEILSDYDRIMLLEERIQEINSVMKELKGYFLKGEPISNEILDPECDMYSSLLIRRGIHHMGAEISWLNEVITKTRKSPSATTSLFQGSNSNYPSSMIISQNPPQIHQRFSSLGVDCPISDQTSISSHNLDRNIPVSEEF